MTSKVYFGSVIPGRASRFANMSQKLEKIIENLDLSTIEKKDKVAIKMHLGFNDGYQTVPIFFVRRIVSAVKKAGGYPYITDNPTAVYNAVDRGYTQETCGCPLIPVAGVKDGYTKKQKVDFLEVKELEAGGALLDADALINLTHSKGHGLCSYGGAIKNIALGGFKGPHRWYVIHDVVHQIEYYDKSKMTKEHIEKLQKVCHHGSPNWNERKKTGELMYYSCDQCHLGEQPCVEADDDLTGWQIKEENFDAFQEMMAVSSKIIYDNYDKDKVFNFNFALDITPFCDCMGMAMPNVIDDIGILGSKDLVAVDVATLDLMKEVGLNMSMLKKIPDTYVRPNPNPSPDLHPLQVLFGPYKDPYKTMRYAEERGLGSTKYELIEVLSAEETSKMEPPKHVYEAD